MSRFEQTEIARPVSCFTHAKTFTSPPDNVISHGSVGSKQVEKNVKIYFSYYALQINLTAF